MAGLGSADRAAPALGREAENVTLKGRQQGDVRTGLFALCDQQVLHLPIRQSLSVSLCVGVSNFVLLPLMGGLSDRIGRRPQLICCAVAAFLTAYPALLWMVSAPSFGRLLTVELWLSLVYSGYNGAMIVFLIEVMPSKVRTTAFSLAYSLATAIFGGFTPAICTWLIHQSGNKAAPGLWLSAAAVCGLVASLLLGQGQSEGVSGSRASNRK